MVLEAGSAFLIGFGIFILAILVILNLLAGRGIKGQEKGQIFFQTILSNFKFEDLLVFTLLLVGVLQMLVFLFGINTIVSLTPAIRMTIFVGAVAVILYGQERYLKLGGLVTSAGDIRRSALPTLFGIYLTVAVLVIMGIGIFFPTFLSQFRDPLIETFSIIGSSAMSMVGMGGP